jgi:amidase
VPAGGGRRILGRMARELHELSALEQAERIRGKTLRSEELVRHYLDRIARLDGRYSAFVRLVERRAIFAAQRADLRRGASSSGPFHGVPTGIKDLHFVRAVFSRNGTRGLPPLLGPMDDSLVAAIRRGGFVIVGKTTTSELALLPVVEPDIHPPTRNPWNVERTAGCSSGGAGAAVSARLVPIAPGSDGAGSIRIPAACCGLYGHKPTRGLVPNPHARVDEFGMTAIGPLARTVDDGAALLDVLTGRRPGGSGSFLATARIRPPRMTIGLQVRSPLGTADPICVEAAEQAASALERAGHRVIPLEGASASLDEFLPIYQRLMAAVPVLFEGRLQPITRWFRAEGRKHTAEDARRRHEMLTRRSIDAMGDCDVVLSPTTAVVAPKVFATRELAPELAFRELAHLGAFTASANITGAPASSVPWSIVDGMPTGVQLLGRQGEDARVVALARELEGLRGGSFVPPGVA